VKPTLAARLDARLAAGNLDLPFLPGTTSQILDLCDDPEVDMKALAAAVGADPTFAAHFLRLSNSPVFAARARILSLHQAVARLGTKQVRQVVLLITCHSRAFHVRGRKGMAREMLEHAVATAVFAQEIALARGQAAEEAFMCGLLHDIGSPAVLQLVSDLEVEDGAAFDDDALLKNIDRLHEGVGFQIASQWSTSPAVSESIGSHHRVLSPFDRSPTALAVATIQLAEAMADGLDAKLLLEHPAVALLELPPEEVERLSSAHEATRLILDSLG
jgi:putative nucleotidyltransferase with HDIG domain